MRASRADQEDGVARNSRELARRPAVDPEEEPSVEWGWHGGFPRGMLVAGWGVVVILLLFNFTNNNLTNHTANVWLTGVAILMAIGLVLHSVRKRNSWRR
ncbi:hypothetical protein BJF78_30430 [Pseudonocardia sp. CNS-139]|nr:hypothetical protein BJF78_30430 [Pseudonocardia sp. CNS-139]